MYVAQLEEQVKIAEHSYSHYLLFSAKLLDELLTIRDCRHICRAVMQLLRLLQLMANSLSATQMFLGSIPKGIKCCSIHPHCFSINMVMQLVLLLLSCLLSLVRLIQH